MIAPRVVIARFIECLRVCVLSHFSRIRLFAILWTIALQVPLFMGFSRQEYWNGLPGPPPGDPPSPEIEPGSLKSPALVDGFFTTEPPVMIQFSSVQSLSRVRLFATP